jgi:hypothetical protein
VCLRLDQSPSPPPNRTHAPTHTPAHTCTQLYTHRHTPTHTTIQVYSSYRLRRDLAEAAKPPIGALAAARHLSGREVAAGAVHDARGSSSCGASNSGGSSGGTPSSQPGVPLDPADMRQAIAWQLCHRQMMHAQTAAAAETLRAAMSADAVRDVQVCVCVRVCAHVVCPATVTAWRSLTTLSLSHSLIFCFSLPHQHLPPICISTLPVHDDI